MGLIVILVFLGVFAVVALVLVALTANASQKTKQIIATLDSALATDVVVSRDQVLNLRKAEKFSAIPWINRELQKLELAPRLQRMLSQAELKWTAGSLLAMCAGGFAFPAWIIGERTGSFLFAILGGLIVGSLPLAYVVYKRGKRFGVFEQGLPEALELMVSALRAGHSLIAAMGLVARECADPIGSEFRSCFEEQNYGLELNTAMENMLTRVPLQDLRIVSTAIMIQKESGGNLAEVLDKTSHVIRERFRLKRQVMTHTAQGRLTGIILTLLPIGLGIALYFVNPDMMSILWKRDIGIKLLWAAAGMTVVGGLIIRHIVNMEV